MVLYQKHKKKEMQEQELAQKIRDYIKTLYNAEFTGLLLVEKLNPGFKCILGIPSYMIQTSFASDSDSEEEFLEYVYSELRTRNYIRQEFYKVTRNFNSKEE